MASPAESPTQAPTPRAFFSWLAGALILLAAGAGLLVGRSCSYAPTDDSLRLRDTANVITAVRDLARLEGAEYHLERVIELTDNQRRLFGLVEAKDAILLVAAGEVTAGVELGELRENDVAIDRDKRSVRFTLPPPRITGARLDNQRTFVYRRDTGLLAERRESLEAEARARAEQSILEAARAGGIEQRAAENVAKAVEGLSRSLGYESVEVSYRR